MKKRLLVGLVVIAGAAAVFVYTAEQPGVDPQVVAISGNIEIVDVEVAFRVPGRVIERRVSEGETVSVGQVVAVLDDTEFAHEVRIRGAAKRAADARLAELTAGSRPEEIGQARAALARAQAEAERAEVEFVRQTGLLAREVISRREFETATAAHRVAQARVEEAAQKLELVERGPRVEQIDLAREEVGRAEEALALAETRLSYAVLSAPVSGLVLAEHVEVGENVTAGTPVVTVGNLAEVWLRGYIDETELGHVRVGQAVRVTTDAYPNKIYNGAVTFISSEAEFTPKSVQTTRERVKLVYRIKVDVANPMAELKPGMPADAVIVLGPR